MMTVFRIEFRRDLMAADNEVVYVEQKSVGNWLMYAANDQITILAVERIAVWEETYE